MSTWWYFECHSHDPIIRSASEFTQHTGDKHYKVALELANRRPLKVDMDKAIFEDEAAEHFGRNMIWFLQQHPNCELKIIDEYGKRDDIPPTPMTVRMLMSRLSELDPDAPLAIFSQKGTGVLRAGEITDPDSIDIIEEDDKGRAIFSR